MTEPNLLFSITQICVFCVMMLVLGFGFGWVISKLFHEYKESNNRWHNQ